MRPASALRSGPIGRCAAWGRGERSPGRLPRPRPACAGGRALRRAPCLLGAQGPLTLCVAAGSGRFWACVFGPILRVRALSLLWLRERGTDDMKLLHATRKHRVGWGGASSIHARVYSQDGGLRVPLVGTRYLAAAALRSGRGPDPARDDAAARARGPAEEAAAALPRTAALCGAGSSSSLDSLSSLSLSESPSSPSPAPSATGASASLGSRFTLVRYPMNNLASWFDGSSSRTAAASARTRRMRFRTVAATAPRAARGRPVASDRTLHLAPLTSLAHWDGGCRPLRGDLGREGCQTGEELIQRVCLGGRRGCGHADKQLAESVTAQRVCRNTATLGRFGQCEWARRPGGVGAAGNVCEGKRTAIVDFDSGWRSFGPLNGHHTLARYACMTTQAGL